MAEVRRFANKSVVTGYMSVPFLVVPVGKLQKQWNNVSLSTMPYVHPPGEGGMVWCGKWTMALPNLKPGSHKIYWDILDIL